jgi:hemolysin III
MRGWLHLAGVVLTLVAGPVLVAQATTGAQRAALVVYVLSMLALFGVSAAFHLHHWGPVGRRRMRRADHSTIFLAIAGSYTAVAVLVLHGAAEFTILLVVWLGALAGVILRQVWLDAPKWVVAIPYVVVGWSAVLVLPPLYRGLGGWGFALLVLGGLAYTAGAVVYAIKRPDPAPATFGYHEVFHLCTLVGATLQFVVIAGFALPRA